MAENKIVGYKYMFGFILPDWVDESFLRMVVVFLLSSVAMFFVLIFVIQPKFSIIETQKIDLVKKQTQLDLLRSSKEGFDKLNEQIPTSTQDLILKAIGQSYSPENSIYILRNLSNDVAGVSIVSYSLSPGVLYESDKKEVSSTASKGEKNMVNIVSHPIKLTVAAPIGSLLSFINKIETSLPLGVVSDVGMQEISKLAKSSVEEKSINMDLEIKYYQADVAQVDITKLLPFTDEDLALAKEISGYSQVGVGSVVNEVPVAINNTENLFGF